MNNPLKYMLPYDEMFAESSESSEELTLEYIIENKPITKIVREFFRDNLAGILSEEEKMFSKR